MKHAILSLLTVSCAILGLLFRPVPIPAASQKPPAKVTERAWAAGMDHRRADLIVTVAGYPDLSLAQTLPTKEARTRFVFETLTGFAARAQAGLQRELAARRLPFVVLWISNSIAIPAADQATMQWLAARQDVAGIDLDIKMRHVEPGDPGATPSSIEGLAEIVWGVARVHAPEVWALGYRGQGVVVAGLDTGVQWDHPALAPQYRGWNGVTATHDYNWFDPTGKSALLPTDDNSHGSHTLGTVAGDDGASHQVGVAPGARWIACRNMNSGIGSVSLYTACFQFALAPTDLNGNNPDPSKAADITSNSWSCDPGFGEIGCEVPSSLVTVTQVLRWAGIMVIAAAGNSGPTCSTVMRAPGTYTHVFTIGATDALDGIAGFSGRGPSAFDGTLKPDVVAPGVGVLSSVPGNDYSTKSGTSMATPHVAGVAALLWSAAPGLRGNVDETEAILRRSARPLTSGQACGGVPGVAIPNNTYGYGLVDARAALSETLRGKLTASVPAPTLPWGEPITFTFTLTNFSALTRTGTVLTASLPLSTAFVSALPGAVHTAGIVTWTVGELFPASVTTATLVVTADRPGTLVLDEYGAASNDGISDGVRGAPAGVFVFSHKLWLINVQR